MNLYIFGIQCSFYFRVNIRPMHARNAPSIRSICSQYTINIRLKPPSIRSMYAQYTPNIHSLSQRGRVGSKPACNGKSTLRSPPAVD